MFRVIPDGKDYIFEIRSEPPLIYLDHWALRLFSSNSRLRVRFFESFRTRGTLMFSLMNIAEIERDPHFAAWLAARYDRIVAQGLAFHEAQPPPARPNGDNGKKTRGRKRRRMSNHRTASRRRPSSRHRSRRRMTPFQSRPNPSRRPSTGSSGPR